LKNFEELCLIAPVARALKDENYSTPTPIQAQTIPGALEGRDILGCAQTGTGKTAAFALPILHRLGGNNRKAPANRPFVLVLAPTRELAIQIGQSFATYGKHLRLRQALVYGGVNQNRQVNAMNQGSHILVATPGRLLDLMNQGHIKLDRLEYFVLDEADRMMDMGFLPDLKRIIAKLPKRRQSLFFSATLEPKIVELSRSLLHKPLSVRVTPKTTSAETVQQSVMFVEKKEKTPLLRKILDRKEVKRVLVFTKTKRGANQVGERLEKTGVRVAVIHGNKSQNARVRALDAFRSNRVKVLVATDVAARGIDIDGITHVVNFDLPVEPEAYVHRIGRTGRAGAEGVAFSFCSPVEQGELKAIERLIGKQVPIAMGTPSKNPPPKTSHSGGSKRPSSKRSGSKRKKVGVAATTGKPKRKWHRPKGKPGASRSKPR